MPKINQEEYAHINWLLKRVKKEINRKDESLGLIDWNSTQADRLSGQIEAFEHIEMLINEIGKPSYFRNKHRLEESEETEVKEDIQWSKDWDWARREFNKLYPGKVEVYVNQDDKITTEIRLLNKIQSILDQLGEPEVPKQETEMSKITVKIETVAEAILREMEHENIHRWEIYDAIMALGGTIELEVEDNAKN